MTWFFYATMASVLWGLSYCICERILIHISSATLITLELVLGSVIYLSVFNNKNLYKEISIIFQNKLLLWLIFVEIIVFSIANYTIWESVKLSKNAGLAALIEMSYPLFAILFSLILFKINHFTLANVLGGVFIFIGIMIIRLGGQIH